MTTSPGTVANGTGIARATERGKPPHLTPKEARTVLEYVAGALGGLVVGEVFRRIDQWNARQAVLPEVETLRCRISRIELQMGRYAAFAVNERGSRIPDAHRRELELREPAEASATHTEQEAV